MFAQMSSAPSPALTLISGEPILSCASLRPCCSHVAGVVGLWQRLHLPFPHVFGPIHAIVEFGGGILLIVGLFTRIIGFLLAVDILGALFLVKIHTPTFIQQVWLAFWISLALLAVGAGSLSLEAFLGKRRVEGTSQLTAYQH